MKNSVLKYLGFCIILITLSSCGSTKRALNFMESFDYKIKQIHMENLNSSYDRLIADYLEDTKSSAQKKAEAYNRDTLAHMYKTPCFGNCPTYSITIYNNGNVKYEGIRHVEMTGIFESKLEPEQKTKLKDYLNNLDLTKMPSRYPANVDMVADLSVTKLVLSNDEFKYDIVINYGEPQNLKDIKLYLEQLIGELSWVQI